MTYKHFDADKTQLNSLGNAPSNPPAGSPAKIADDTHAEKPGLLKGVSFTQILATSLAAVTAFVLSNQIGIAGSIIGVAVGAAASALASQIYQNVIRRSTHSFRNSENEQVDSSYEDADSTLPAHPYVDQSPVDVTQQMPQYTPAQQRYENAAQQYRTPKLSRKRVRALTIVTIISIIFTISAVILYAMFLSYITDGSGLGPKVSTTPVVTEKTTNTSNSTDKKDDSSSSSEKTDESSKSTDSKDSSSESTDSKKSETTSSDSSSSSEKTSDSSRSSSSSSSSESNSSSNNSGTGSSNSNSGSNQNSGSGNSSSNGSSGSGSNSSNGGN